jgi:hypothetical protein
MGCDMLVALGSATVQGHTLFGLNWFDTSRQRLRLRSFQPSYHSPDETIQTRHVELPQIRQTGGVLGIQPENSWGLVFGCNETGVAVGVAQWRSQLVGSGPGLTGTELTRLALERSHSARHAAEVLTDLIARHGQGDPSTEAPDSVFLIADAHEACVLEVAGNCWALLECPESRAVSDAGLIRQDWQRLSPGLADRAIQSGWWHDDGTKLDFVGSLGGRAADPWSLKRWSKATLALAQHQGSLDVYGLRRLLAEHFEKCARGSAPTDSKPRRCATLAARLPKQGAPVVWFAGGASAAPLHFPLLADAPLPEAWTTRPPHDDAPIPRSLVERLQNSFDQDAEEFFLEAQPLRERGEQPAVRRLAQALMHKHLEQWEEARNRPASLTSAAVSALKRDEELAPFAFG